MMRNNPDSNSAPNTDAESAGATKKRLLMYLPVGLIGLVLLITGFVGMFAPSAVVGGEVNEEIMTAMESSELQSIIQGYLQFSSLWVCLAGAMMIWSVTLCKINADAPICFLYGIFGFYLLLQGLVVKMGVQGGSGCFKSKEAEGAGYLLMSILILLQIPILIKQAM